MLIKNEKIVNGNKGVRMSSDNSGANPQLSDSDREIIALRTELERERHLRRLAEINNVILQGHLSAAEAKGSRWEEIAHTDQLTSIYNLRGGVRALNEQLERRHSLTPEQRTKQHFEILFVDLDGFGQVNKKYGDATGDVLLKELATALKNCLRGTDFIYRKGGDEIVICLDGSPSEEGIETVFEKIAKVLDGEITITGPNGEKIDVRGSIGRVRWDDNLSYAENFAKADDIMRERKAARKLQQRLTNPDYSVQHITAYNYRGVTLG